MPARRLTPLRAALAAMLVYLGLLAGLAAWRGFDLSVFIFAGDEFVDAAAISPPIAVARNSIGYDGQFFYRFARDPWSTDPTAGGITLDIPAKRMQRIFYPLLARAAALGNAAWLPASLVAVNLAGIGLLAAAAAWLTRRRALPGWLPWAILAWPGLLVALAHDTAEIVTAALLLTALACYLSGRLLAYCLLAAAALLTRETALPIPFGILLVESWTALRPTPATPGLPGLARRLRRPLACGLALLPFALWWQLVSLIWHRPPQPLHNTDIGWPFLGIARMLRATLDGSRHWNADPAGDFITRVYVVLTTLGLLAFGVLVLLRLARLRHRTELHGIALGWVMTAGLMSLLTASSPLIEPLSYFRALTEFWLVGCLLLAHAPPTWLQARLPRILAIFAAIWVNLVVWKWSLWLLG